MAVSLTFPRVAGDIGPPYSVTDEGFDATGWLITFRSTKANGEQYTRPAVIDDFGDPGAGTPARYHFDFEPEDLLGAGDQAFDLHFSKISDADFSIPEGFKFTLRVRNK